METEPPAFFRRLRTLLAPKLGMALGLNLLVCIPYFGLQHLVLRPVTWIPASALDRAIHFSEASVWLYQSLYLLMPVAPMLMIHAAQLRRYALGMAAMSLGANVVFLAFPTAVVRPDPAGAGAVYRALVRYDAPLHALPSLHAAFAIFSALCCTAVFREMRLARGWPAAVWLWTLAILYATLATKQHVALDLAGGALLAGLALRFALWPHRMRPGIVPSPRHASIP